MRFAKEALINLSEAASTRQKQAKKLSLSVINKHKEPDFLTMVIAMQVINQNFLNYCGIVFSPVQGMKATRALLIFLVVIGLGLFSGCSHLKLPKILSPTDKGAEEKPTLKPVAKQASEGFNLALKAMQAGEDDLALALFRELQIQYPELSGPWLNTGIILMKQEKHEEALTAFEKTISINPLNKYAYNQLGLNLRQLGRFEDAKDAYKLALKIDPNYALSHYNLGVLLELYFQDLKGAYEHFLSYQNLQSEKDKTVDNWIKDLRRRANIPEPEPIPKTKSAIDTQATEETPIDADKNKPQANTKTSTEAQGEPDSSHTEPESTAAVETSVSPSETRTTALGTNSETSDTPSPPVKNTDSTKRQSLW